MEHKLLFSIVIFLIISFMIIYIMNTSGVPKGNKVLALTLYSFCIVGIITMNFVSQ